MQTVQVVVRGCFWSELDIDALLDAIREAVDERDVILFPKPPHKPPSDADQG